MVWAKETLSPASWVSRIAEPVGIGLSLACKCTNIAFSKSLVELQRAVYRYINFAKDVQQILSCLNWQVSNGKEITEYNSIHEPGGRLGPISVRHKS